MLSGGIDINPVEVSRENRQEAECAQISAVTRRQFLEIAAGASIVASFPSYTGAAEPKGEVPRRTLGRTGEKVSAIGLGGHHIGRQKEEKESIRIIRAAIDAGITFMDNCWDYNAGASEMRMGKALRDGYRDQVFLMTKIDGRSRKEATRQLEESLRRLQVDHIDLVQHHEVIRYEDPHRIFAEEGANAALVEARDAGKLRYIGFTGHKDPHIHLHMLDVAADHGFRFDAVQMPLNVMDAHYRSFERQVLPRLVREGIGVLGMKSMAEGIILETRTVTPIECLHYALNCPRRWSSPASTVCRSWTRRSKRSAPSVDSAARKSKSCFRGRRPWRQPASSSRSRRRLSLTAPRRTPSGLARSSRYAV